MELLARAEILFHRKPGVLASCMETPWRTSWRLEGAVIFYQGKPDVVCRVSVRVSRKIKGTEDKDFGGKSRFLSLG